ncbi:MAG: amidophosphoribosyltransferase [Deltaproteobacteria bacterium]|jgi:amidophosphoribosyltransferase|nr:amidophosphoribosyltransferase [Deltaproteobacteria bacterium]
MLIRPADLDGAAWDMDDKARDACGIVGIYGIKEAAQLAVLGLHALQHRGQESAGIVSCNAGNLYSHRGMGLVSNVFGQGEAQKLPGNFAIGHVRYSTAGGSNIVNAQPLLALYSGGEIALAHNGNLAGGDSLRRKLLEQGALLQTGSDSEFFLHLLAQQQATAEEQIAGVLEQAGAAFSILILTDKRMIAARDPWGFRPLALGRLGDGFVAASESCAFDQMGATFEREIDPGEMLTFTPGGYRSTFFGKRGARKRNCLLELIYFARPDSFVFGRFPHIFRRQSGHILAREHPAEADMVVAIPDSGFSAAMGYAEELNMTMDRGIIRNHYIGRSFIAPGQAARATAVRMKHNVVREVVKGKRLALIDDSLIRGTTTAALGKELRDAGATEVHLRIACPPTRHPCLYGVDFPHYTELMAYRHSIDEIKSTLNMDSLGYLSIEGIAGILGEDGADYCTACWTGEYLAGP